MPSSNHPDNTALKATDSITTATDDPASTSILSELSIKLSELHPLAAKIVDLKKETLEKEASTLKAILEKMAPLVPLLSDDYELTGKDHELPGKDNEQCYRREIVILAREERVQLENFSIFSEHRLILYENGLLARTHRYGECSDDSRPGWENTDEDMLTPEAAILIFGFTDISKGLIKTVSESSSMAVFKGKLEGRIAELTQVLEILQ